MPSRYFEKGIGNDNTLNCLKIIAATKLSKSSSEIIDYLLSIGKYMERSFQGLGKKITEQKMPEMYSTVVRGETKL